MPFNNTTKRFDRVWRFVDQFLANENATRSAFDVTIDDVQAAVNAAIAYLEGRDDAIAVSATDLRYIGAFSAAPATRIGGGALVLGDFYFDTDDDEFLTYDGAVFVSTTGLTATMRSFLALIETDDDAAVRTLIGLGTAATQNSTAFATAAQGALAEDAVQAPDGVAVNVTNWANVHSSGTGFYEGAAGAVNSPVAVACTGFYIKKNSTSGVLTVTDQNGRTFRSVFSSSNIGPWKEVAQTATGGLSSFIVTLLDDLDQIEARTTLGAQPLSWSGPGIGQFTTLLAGPSAALSLPAGGSWLYWFIKESTTSGAISSVNSGFAAGGSVISAATASTNTIGWAWRIA